MQKFGSMGLLLMAFAMFGGLLWKSTDSLLATALVLTGLAVLVLGSNGVIEHNRAKRGLTFSMATDPRDLLALTRRDWAWLALVLVTGAALCFAGVLALAWGRS